jgi:cell wall assembly regulator SMI1
MENVGDRLFLWGGYHKPMNEQFANQLLAHHFPESKFKLAIDPAFDFQAWLASIGFISEQYTVSENEKIKVSYDDDRLNIYRNTESLSYCLIPQTHFFAGQLLAHCLSGKKQVSSLSITALVAEILALYKQVAPVMLAREIIPATETELIAFEADFGQRLPEDYREFLLVNTIAHHFMGNYNCLSFERMVEVRQRMNQLLAARVFDDGRVEQRAENYSGKRFQRVWWDRQWIPFCEDGCGNMRCIDCNPAEQGTKYQLLDMEIQDGMGPLRSKYGTFRQVLQQYKQRLLTKNFVLDEWVIEMY